ncbi:SDR family oxidoreductase, partial [Micromonospora arida]
MTKNVDEQPILVLGGTGKTGRRVVDRLAKLGRPVRVGSRAGEPPFDWTDQRTWAPVLDGVSSVYLVYYPDL